ncbi:MAG: crossover junction endodeoxyribonuclease RuvC [Cyanobacteria bacterium J06642_2]
MTSPIRILGIDPGMGMMGFGAIAAFPDAANVQFIECGVITTPKHTPVAYRLQTLYEDLTELIRTLTPNWVGLEKLFFYRMGNTIQVAQARGVILLVLAQHDLLPQEFTPAQIKQTLTGYGTADKRAVQEAVTRDLKLEKIPRPDDAADGLAIALTAWHHRFERQTMHVETCMQR